VKLKVFFVVHMPTQKQGCGAGAGHFAWSRSSIINQDLELIWNFWLEPDLWPC